MEAISAFVTPTPMDASGLVTRAGERKRTRHLNAMSLVVTGNSAWLRDRWRCFRGRDVPGDARHLQPLAPMNLAAIHHDDVCVALVVGLMEHHRRYRITFDVENFSAVGAFVKTAYLPNG